MKLPHLRRRVLGFSLVELLVVMTIMGLLAAMGVVNFRSASRKARNERRQADIEKLRAGLEVYRSANGSYYVAVTTIYSFNSSPLLYNWPGPFITALSSFVDNAVLPIDPTNNATYRYSYSSAANGRTYSVCYSEETTGAPVSRCKGNP